MGVLGFKHTPSRKYYYVDTHKSPENIEYCNNFIQLYFSYALRRYHWLSVTTCQRDEMVKRGQIDNGLGYERRTFFLMSC